METNLVSTEFAQGAAMVPEGSSGPAFVQEAPIGPHETRTCVKGTESGERRGESGKIIALFEGGVGEPPEEWRIKEANRRLEVLKAFWRLIGKESGERRTENALTPALSHRMGEGEAQMGEGEARMGEGAISRAKAAVVVGEDYVSIWRWEKAWKAGGYNGLLPRTHLCGRKSVFEKLGMTEEEVKRVAEEVRGLNLDTKSVTSALRVYANSDRCTPELAAVILDPGRCSKHALPPSLRKAARVGLNERKAHEGPRALSLGGIWTPRKLDILPGDIFTTDDTTPIWAWWVPWAESEEYPFGVKVLQGQFLPVMDVASQAVITFVLIAREKSSYRASDIWHLFGHTFSEVGLPRLGWQLERGSFEANLVRGQEVEYREGEVTMSRRVGGLRQLPTNVTEWHRQEWIKRNPEATEFPFPKSLQTWTSYLPKSKSIEGWFNRHQTLEGTLWGCLGRDQMRAPFEKAKRLYQECARGARDPREHFLSGEEMGKKVSGLIEYINNEPMEGEVFSGVPAQKFAAGVKEYPLYHLSPELQWLYRREWAVVKITQGWARVRLTHGASGERYSLFYCNPEVFAGREGEQVAVYYDREQFEKPAQIVLARTGEYLCEAGYEERRGSFLSGDRTGHEVAARWKGAVMSIYGTIVRHAPSRQGPERGERRAESGERGGKGSEQEKEQEKALTPALSHRMGEGERVKVVDCRPDATEVRGGRTVVDAAAQRRDVAEQAEIAASLRALRGEE